MRLFVDAVGYSVFSTYRQRVLAMRAPRSLRSEARPLVHGSIFAVGFGGVGRRVLLFIVAASSSASSTPSRNEALLRDEARRLEAASHALAVEGGSVQRAA